MAKIQCKICGGELNLPEGVLSGECPYCGTLTTFPKVASEELENLYNRAEHFRRINEYDKAVAAYEKIVEIDPEDAEAYWGLVISKFGIEYVEDPVSHERIPTCHRVHYESILADADYLNALEKAGSYEKGIYEAEAKRIAEIQRDILSISNNEQPFDVFICYKESDNYGRRTKDSVTAQEIYYQLTDAGYKVFFARITLESKLGQQYEPYIFAALNSAKVMLVIGSEKEYFDAVWVRNEWSRFLALMKKERSKLLIPCYRDMDAYDIPDALSVFQAQDMSKIGFIQDLLHGIKKVFAVSARTGNCDSSGTTALSPLLRRAKLFLEHNDFDSAREYCERTLDQEPENPWAYFYRMMAELQIKDSKKLPYYDFKNSRSYLLTRQFANAEMNAILDRAEAEQQKNMTELEKHSAFQQKIRKESENFANLLFHENQALYKRHDVIAVLQNCITMSSYNDLSNPGNIEVFQKLIQKEKKRLLSTRAATEVSGILECIDNILKAADAGLATYDRNKPPVPVPQAPPENKPQPEENKSGCLELATKGCGCAFLACIILLILAGIIAS